MKNRLITFYGIFALIIASFAIIWFVFSVTADSRKGKIEAEQSFTWISRETVSTALSDGFMTDSFIRKVTLLCQQSHILSAVVISTPSGAVFTWPQNSASIQYDSSGKPQITNTSVFMKDYSKSLDIGDGKSGAIVMTAVMYVLLPDAVYSASKNSFMIVLALLLVTLIVIFSLSPVTKQKVKPLLDTLYKQPQKEGEIEVSLSSALEGEVIDDSAVTVPEAENQFDVPCESTGASVDDADILPDSKDIITTVSNQQTPEGLFSPITGTGWEQYLVDRLDAELVRAASSEQDLSLIVIRVSGILHTDLISRKIAQILLDTIKFRDMVFEFGQSGFAGILQNMNLDQTMKIADELYSGIDAVLMEMSFDGQITIGLTTRTARLLPASRMIEEAVSAAKKAEEEPSLPIVAFRANPEKYRNFVSENAN